MHSRRIKNGLRRILGLKIASRFAAWACIAAIAVLSLAPAQQMQRTGLSGHLEHVLAYMGAAFIVMTAYAERGITQIIFVLLTYAGALEFLQRFSPGRTSDLGDYAFSAAGVLMGVVALVLLRKWLAVADEPSNGPSSIQISN